MPQFDPWGQGVNLTSFLDSVYGFLLPHNTFKTSESNNERDVSQIFKIVNFNYLNVAFISYKLTMWDFMLFSGCHTRGQRLRKKDRSC